MDCLVWETGGEQQVTYNDGKVESSVIRIYVNIKHTFQNVLQIASYINMYEKGWWYTLTNETYMKPTDEKFLERRISQNIRSLYQSL